MIATILLGLYIICGIGYCIWAVAAELADDHFTLVVTGLIWPVMATLAGILLAGEKLRVYLHNKKYNNDNL